MSTLILSRFDFYTAGTAGCRCRKCLSILSRFDFYQWYPISIWVHPWLSILSRFDFYWRGEILPFLALAFNPIKVRFLQQSANPYKILLPLSILSRFDFYATNRYLRKSCRPLSILSRFDFYIITSFGTALAMLTFNPIKVRFLPKWEGAILSCIYCFQSYQGSIFTSSNHHRDIACGIFQSYQGSIFTRKLRNILDWIKLAFNPIKVRFLQNFHSHSGMIHFLSILSRFDFYTKFHSTAERKRKLSILSRFDFYKVRYNNEEINEIFQSYQGSIFTDLTYSMVLGSRDFQSYQGSIFTNFKSGKAFAIGFFQSYQGSIFTIF